MATGEPARVSVTNITAGLFPRLGVQSIVGRTFLSAEGKQGQDHVALLNETLWRSQFGADPHILGKTIRLNGVASTTSQTADHLDENSLGGVRNPNQASTLSTTLPATSVSRK
jgi:hypothetical protein